MQPPLKPSQPPINAINPYAPLNKKKGVFSTTGAEWITSIYLVLGLISFLAAGYFVTEFELEIAFFCFGISLLLFFGAIVVAVHAVEKAIMNQEK